MKYVLSVLVFLCPFFAQETDMDSGESQKHTIEIKVEVLAKLLKKIEALEQQNKALEDRLAEITECVNRLKNKATWYYHTEKTFTPPIDNKKNVWDAGQVISDISKDIVVDTESTFSIDFSAFVHITGPYNAVSFGIFVDQEQVGNIVQFWNTSPKSSGTVSIIGVKYKVKPGTHRVEVKALAQGDSGGSVLSASLRIQ